MIPVNLNLSLLLPEATAVGMLLILLVVDMLRPTTKHLAPPASFWNLAFAGGGLVLLSLIPLLGKTGLAFDGKFISDPLAVFFKAFWTLTALAVILMSREFFKDRIQNTAEFLLILWSSLTALFFLVSAMDFLIVFIALETFALSLYIMSAYLKKDIASIEAGLKYLLLGSLASAFMIFGIALLYVAAGSTSFIVIRDLFTQNPESKLMLLGLLLVFTGLGFKIASVPFQFWAPDVYEGAPTPVVAYLSVASKAAGFALLLRVFFVVFPAFDTGRTMLFSVLAAMTLLYGNLAALLQTNIKRLFGYSSIGHAGYLLIGLAAGQEVGLSAVLYYLMAFAAANLAAFLVITVVGTRLGSDRIEAYRGLGKRSPFLAGSFFLALLSLAGVPPLAGFFGKFMALLSAVQGNLSWLALVGSLTVAVSLYYYLNLVRIMYFDATPDEEPIPVPCTIKAVLTVLAVFTVLAGFWQAPFLHIVRQVAQSLL